MPSIFDMMVLSAEDITFQHTMHFQRDFPVPYDIVVENIGDQSHVPFAHHGVAGSRCALTAHSYSINAHVFCLAVESCKLLLDEQHLPVILQSGNQCPAFSPQCPGTHETATVTSQLSCL